MTTLLLAVAVIVGVMIIVGLYRVAKGPTVYDRLVAAALVSANGLVLLILVSFLFDRVEMFVDIALGYALLAFTLPIALAKYFERGDGR